MRIAVLGYGSLVNNLHSTHYHATLEVSPFLPAEGLELPICLGRISSANTDRRRITMVLCEQASPRQAYFAEACFDELDKAIENLRTREGIGPRGIHYISYMNLRDGTKRSRYDFVAEKVNDWAKINRFDAVIWTDLPENGIKFHSSFKEEEILPLLLSDPVLLANTKGYIRDLPNPPTPLYQEILTM